MAKSDWDTVDITGKVCIVTGASDGIGVPTAKHLAKQGGHVILAVRNLEKGQKVADDIIRETGNNKVEVSELDLSSFASVRKFADNFRKRSLPIHLLINNAGIFQLGHKLTADGFEQHLQVNHLSHFLLTNLLLDIIISSAPSRIINVSSDSHLFAKGIDWENMNGEKQPNPGMMHWYEQSKLCNVLFTRELQRRFNEQKVAVTTHALHPGNMVPTNISTNNPWYVRYAFNVKAFLGLSKTVDEGSWTTLTAALVPKYGEEGGLYFNSDSKPGTGSKPSQDMELASKLWDVSVNLTKLNQ